MTYSPVTLMTGRPRDRLDALSVQNGVIFLQKASIAENVHKIEIMLPHKMPTMNNWGASC